MLCFYLLPNSSPVMSFLCFEALNQTIRKAIFARNELSAHPLSKIGLLTAQVDLGLILEMSLTYMYD